MAKGNVGLSRSRSISDPIKELIADSLELITDTQISEGILKDLPIAGSFFKLHKVYTSIKDQIFFKKLNRFISELEDIPVKDKEQFWNKYDGSEEEKRNLGEQLIIYLDRHDTVDKATLLARAFGAYINNKIQKSDFLDLAVFIDSVQTHYFEEITSILVLAGDGIFYKEINVSTDVKRLIPLMEVQRLLEYEDETKIIEDRLNKSIIKTYRKHRKSTLGQNFLDFVIPELSIKVSNEIKKFYAEQNRIIRTNWEKKSKENEDLARPDL